MAGFWDNFLASCVALAALLVVAGVLYTVWQAVALKKRQRYFARIHGELAPGQEVVFGGGIYGTVQGIDGDRVSVKVRSGAVMDVSRYSVQSVEGK